MKKEFLETKKMSMSPTDFTGLIELEKALKKFYAR